MMQRSRLFIFVLAWAVCAVTMTMPSRAHGNTFEINSGWPVTGTSDIGSPGYYSEWIIDSGGELDVGGQSFPSGTLNNNSGGSLYNYGTLMNYANGTLNNSSTTLENYGWLATYGTLNNKAGAVLDNNNGGMLKNPGTLYNYGTLNNNSGGILRNMNILYNYGTLNNNSGALSNNKSGSTLINYGTMTNMGAALFIAGTLANSSTMTNTGAALLNIGTLTNNAVLTNNAGTVAASAVTVLSNDLGAPFNYSGGTVTNGGVVLGTTYAGTLINNGTINGTGAYVQTAGQTTNNESMSQTSVSIQGDTFNQQSGSLTATSTSSSYNITNSGTLNYTGGTITGNILNNTPGQFNIQATIPGSTLTVYGSVMNFGTVHVTQTTAVFTGGFTNNGTFISDPSTIIFKGNFTGTGTVQASTGDTYEFLGTGTDIFNLGSSNLTIASLIIGPGVTLDITGTGSLTFGGTTLRSGDYTGSAVPIPATILLLAPGLACLARFRRRLKG